MFCTRTLEVFAVNRTYMLVVGGLMAVVALVMFFSTPALAVEIQNGGMENVIQKDTKYCADFNVVGCQQDTIKVYKPTVWDTWFGQWDFGQSWTDTHSTGGGSWSTAVWYQPPSSCRWNETSSSCGAVAQGAEGSLLQSNVSFLMQGPSISFWAKKCDFVPVQCKGWRGFWGCNGDQYYGTNNTALNVGRFSFVMSETSGNATSIYPFQASNTWQKFSVVPNINTSLLYNVYWQTLTLGYGDQNPNCVLLDDFTVDYGVNLESPATPYITDMETRTGFPFTTIHTKAGNGYVSGVGLENFKVSKGFQNVALGQIDFLWHRIGSYTCHSTAPSIKLYHTDGSSLDVSSFSTGTLTRSIYTGCGSFCTGDMDCTMQYVFPIVNYTSIYSVNITGAGESSTAVFTIDSNLGVRSTYVSPLTGYETIYGAPDLYPVILKKNVITVNGSHQFEAYNFKPSEYSSSNVKYDLLSSNGTILNTAGASLTFPYGNSTWIDANFVGGYTGAAYINISFKSNPALTYKSNTWSLLPLTGAATTCTSGCDGTTYVTAVTQGQACVRTYDFNATQCINVTPSTPQLILNTTFNFEQPMFGDQGAFTPLTVPWIWFVIGALIAGIVALYFTSSFEISAIVIFTLLAAFTALGIMPLWLGIGIVVVIIAAIVYVVSKVVPIGGGGGGV